MAGALAYALSLKTRGFTGPLSDARGGLNKFSSGVGGLLTKIGPLVAGLAAAGGAASALGIALKSFNVAADLEQTQVAFKTLLGSEEDALKLLKDIKTTAASTPESFNDLAGAARKLLSVSGKDGVVTDLRMIGDLASASQKPIGELAAMYAKIKGGGLVQGEDLNQIGDALGGQALEEFAKVLGVGRGELRKMGSDGKITGDHLEQVFRNLTSQGGMAFGAMAAQSETTRGLISTLKDNVNELFITLGTPINDALKPVFKSAIVMVKRLGQGLSAMVTLTQEAVKQGKLGDIIKTSLQIGLMEGVNYAAGAFAFMAEGLYRSMEFSLRQVWTFLSGGFSEVFGNVFKGVGLMMGGLGKIILSKLGAPFREVVAVFQAGISVAIDKAIAGLLKIPGMETLLGFSDWEQGSFDDYLKEYKEEMNPQKLKDAGQKEIRDGLATVGKAVDQYGEASIGNFKEAFDGFNFEKVEIFDTKSEKSKLKEIGKSLDPKAYQKLMDAMDGKVGGPATDAAKGKGNPATKPAATPRQKVDLARLNSQTGGSTPTPEKRKGLLSAAESLATRYARQSKADKGSFAGFVGKSNLDSAAVRDYAKKNKISMSAAMSQLQNGSRAASPRQARRNAAEKAAREAATKAATEGTLLKIAEKMDKLAVA